MNWSLWAIIAFFSTQDAMAESRFAFQCVGTALTKVDRGDVGEKKVLTRQIYVVDPKANLITRALFPRREFDPVCESKSEIGSVSISTGLITARSADPLQTDPMWTCEFEVDRASGKGRHLIRAEWTNGGLFEMDWDMKCEKATIPVFAPSKLKF